MHRKVYLPIVVVVNNSFHISGIDLIFSQQFYHAKLFNLMELWN